VHLLGTIGGTIVKKILLGSVILLAGISMQSPASAADMPLKAAPYSACGYNAITASNNQISVDFATEHVDYLETFGGPLDSEKGWVPGVSVTGSAMRNWFGLCNVYFFGRGTFLNGTTHYWASGGPVTSNTDGARISEEDFRLGKGFDLANNVMLTPYLGGGARQWGRNLSGPSGYHEDYRHAYLGGGLLLQYSPVHRLVLSTSALVGRTFNSEMEASQNGGFPIPPWTFPLGHRAIFMTESSADYAITPSVHANVGVQYTSFKYGQSPVNPFGFLEPDSRSHNVTVRAGLGWAFDAPLMARY